MLRRIRKATSEVKKSRSPFKNNVVPKHYCCASYLFSVVEDIRKLSKFFFYLLKLIVFEKWKNKRVFSNMKILQYIWYAIEFYIAWKTHGMRWDENFLKVVPWDAMGRFLNRWDGMGWGGWRKFVPWDEFLVPSHPIRSSAPNTMLSFLYKNRISRWTTM